MNQPIAARPLVVGIGGAIRPGSTEAALRIALDAAEAAGARTLMFDGPALARLPHYRSEGWADSEEGRALVAAVRAADGIILASPGYHGTVSGLVKNAIDYIEETAKDGRVYLDGMPCGLIATAYGSQATGSTLATLRAIVHALRGFPTPMGATINSSGGVFRDGACTDERARSQLEMVGRQVVELVARVL